MAATSKRYLHVGTYRQHQIVLDVEGDSIREPGWFTCEMDGLILASRDLEELRGKIDKALSRPFEVLVFHPDRAFEPVMLVNYVASAWAWVTAAGEHIQAHKDLYAWDAQAAAEMRGIAAQIAGLRTRLTALERARNRVFWDEKAQQPRTLYATEMKGGAPLGSILPD